MTDTAGYSDLVFGLFWLLGYRFSPRLADAGGARMWRIDRTADYGALNSMAQSMISTKLIATHLHDGSLLHFANKHVTNLDELKGLKVRAPTRIGTKFLTSIGATPVQMPVPQVPESVSKGVIDGAMVPWEIVPTIKLHEIAKYHLDNAPNAPKMSNSIFVVAMNQAKYDGLPPDLKKVIDANSGIETSKMIGVAFDATTEPAKKLAREAGGTLDTLSQSEYDKWQKATEVVAKDWIQEAGAKGANGQQLLDDAKALIKKNGG